MYHNFFFNLQNLMQEILSWLSPCRIARMCYSFGGARDLANHHLFGIRKNGYFRIKGQMFCLIDIIHPMNHPMVISWRNHHCCVDTFWASLLTNNWRGMRRNHPSAGLKPQKIAVCLFFPEKIRISMNLPLGGKFTNQQHPDHIASGWKTLKFY